MPPLNKYLLYVLCIAGIQTLMYACNANSNGAKQPITDTVPTATQTIDISIAGGFSQPTKIKFDSLYLEKFLNKFPDIQPYRKEIIDFYRKRNFTYAWFDKDGLIEQAWNLYNRLSNLTDEGLYASIPYANTFHQMMDADSTAYSTDKPHPDIELMLTSQYFFYARHVWTGLAEKNFQKLEWDLPRKKVSYTDLLDSLLSTPADTFFAREPMYPQYAKLKAYLKQYRAIEQAGGWPVLKIPTKAYRPGDSSEAIIALKNRLRITGDLWKDDGSAVFDTSLEQAVKRFQRRMGLKEDGIAGKAVINELNVPVSKRIEQIIVNMERCRWLPVALHSDYFIINIPAFTFYAYEMDTLAWTMKVVVGKAIHQTAIFSGNMKYVVFSPYWHIPPGIMAKEILPALRKNPNYLAKNNMEWHGNQIRQKPGPNNALGRVKFLFPNSHHIYLHDTPAKNLFQEDERAFSHGCIRVEQPKRLAMYVLRHQPEWTEEKIDEAMQSNKELYVTIQKPIPVLIAYFTAWVDADGKLNFRKDIYNRDQRLANMILEKKQ